MKRTLLICIALMITLSSFTVLRTKVEARNIVAGTYEWLYVECYDHNSSIILSGLQGVEASIGLNFVNISQTPDNWYWTGLAVHSAGTGAESLLEVGLANLNDGYCTMYVSVVDGDNSYTAYSSHVSFGTTYDLKIQYIGDYAWRVWSDGVQLTEFGINFPNTHFTSGFVANSYETFGNLTIPQNPYPDMVHWCYLMQSYWNNTWNYITWYNCIDETGNMGQQNVDAFWQQVFYEGEPAWYTYAESIVNMKTDGTGLGTINPAGSCIVEPWGNNGALSTAMPSNTSEFWWFWIIRDGHNGSLPNVWYDSNQGLSFQPFSYDYNATAYFSTCNYTQKYVYGTSGIGLTCYADLTFDGKVDMHDIALVVSLCFKNVNSSDWESSGAHAVDLMLNNDGAVNMKDVAIVIANYGHSIGDVQ